VVGPGNLAPMAGLERAVGRQTARTRRWRPDVRHREADTRDGTRFSSQAIHPCAGLRPIGAGRFTKVLQSSTNTKEQA